MISEKNLKINIANKAIKLPPLHVNKNGTSLKVIRRGKLSKLAARLQKESPFALLNEKFDAFAPQKIPFGDFKQ